MNEENKLDEVTGIDALKQQLEEFDEYRKTVEVAVSEMHKTIVNLSERVENNEKIDAVVEQKVSSVKLELEELRKPMGKMAESVGKIDTLSDRMENIIIGLEKTNSQVEGMKDALETVGKKAEKSLELKKKLGDLFKFIISD